MRRRTPQFYKGKGVHSRLHPGWCMGRSASKLAVSDAFAEASQASAGEVLGKTTTDKSMV